MATETQTGMDRAEMKRLLVKSKHEPVNCALAVGDDKSVALLMLARNRSPKALQGDLQKEFPSAFNTQFGTAMVDTDDDPTLVKFMLNKAVTSMARRLVKTLKGTGFRKVQILLEDGSPVEVAAEEEGAEANANGATQQAAPKPDAAALVAALTALIPQIGNVADPARKEAMAKQARDAQANIKLGNLTYAATGIEALRRALAASTAADTPPAADTPAIKPTVGQAPAAEGGDPRAIWREAKEAIDDSLNALAGKLRAHNNPDMTRIADLGLFSIGRNENVGLNKALIEYTGASAERHGAAAQQLRQAIAAYRAMMSKSRAIELLADTPFGANVTFQATLGGALDRIERTLR